MRNDTKLDVLWNEVEDIKKSGGGGSGLPEVTSADNGKLLGVVNGKWNKMDAPSGGVDYSTTEQNTGRKWIDGKDIYQKTYAIDITSSQTGTVLISDYDYIVNIDAVLNNEFFAFPIFTLSSSSYLVAFVDKETNLLTVMRDNDSKHVGIAYVTMYYTKPTPTKSRKKTTKKEEETK